MSSCPVEAGGSCEGGQRGINPLAGCPVRGSILVVGAVAMSSCPVEVGGFCRRGIAPFAGLPVSGLVFNKLTGVKAITVDM